MQTCKTCNCPLMILRTASNRLESRTNCARCAEAARPAPKVPDARKVYRAPRAAAASEAVTTRLRIDAFMSGRTKRKGPTTTTRKEE